MEGQSEALEQVERFETRLKENIASIRNNFPQATFIEKERSGIFSTHFNLQTLERLVQNLSELASLEAGLQMRPGEGRIAKDNRWLSSAVELKAGDIENLLEEVLGVLKYSRMVHADNVIGIETLELSGKLQLTADIYFARLQRLAKTYHDISTKNKDNLAEELAKSIERLCSEKRAQIANEIFSINEEAKENFIED